MADLKCKRSLLSIADGYKRLAERAELRDAKQSVDGAWFGPDALKVIGGAFNAAC
jgi:hypothetical protein